ncbi:MAG TPA: hypothetical protein VFR33_04755 [Candidatus Dormibacteraeota bacterium]|nr:hypothetical protein [Candidatus Dormibacteraeota bacterium]
MANFLLLYSGGGAPSAADRDKIMQAWGGWFGKLGDKIVDPGNPVAAQPRAVGNGSAHKVDGVSGYSILKADSLGAAAELAKGCPVLTSGGNVTVYEITPAM